MIQLHSHVPTKGLESSTAKTQTSINFLKYRKHTNFLKTLISQMSLASWFMCSYFTHSWLVNTPHSVPSSCTICQPVLMVRVSTSDRKYRFGIPFKVRTYLLIKFDHVLYTVCRQYLLYFPPLVVWMSDCTLVQAVR